MEEAADAAAAVDVVVAVDAADSVVFEVLDVFGGATELVKPSSTLDGSIPLRAARACSPLLEGNQFGFQVRLTQPLTFDTSLTGVKLVGMPEGLSRAIAGSMPRVFAEGLLDPRGRWLAFSKGVVARERGDRRQISLFTGLFVRPKAGHWLRLSHAGNRRNIGFGVKDRWIDDPQAFAPLILTLTFFPDTRFPLTLSGELATLAPFVPNVKWDYIEDVDKVKLGRAHADFFDAKYFAQKKKTSTKKYRQMVDKEPEATLGDRQGMGIAKLGPRSVASTSRRWFLHAKGITERVEDGNALSDLPEYMFHNLLPLVCSFDGHHAHVDLDKAVLERFAQNTRALCTESLGAEYLEQNKGAMWYFTKYVTPHQPGEPYFFVKPPALVSTPPGYSTLVDGIPGSGYSVLRGVVATDVFHAVPAVFRIDQPLRRIEVPSGVALTTLLPFPRTLMDATFAKVPWAHAPRLRGLS